MLHTILNEISRSLKVFYNFIIIIGCLPVALSRLIAQYRQHTLLLPVLHDFLSGPMFGVFVVDLTLLSCWRKFAYSSMLDHRLTEECKRFSSSGCWISGGGLNNTENISKVCGNFLFLRLPLFNAFLCP